MFRSPSQGEGRRYFSEGADAVAAVEARVSTRANLRSSDSLVELLVRRLAFLQVREQQRARVHEFLLGRLRDEPVALRRREALLCDTAD